tara:strand:+ start:16137 stop:16931 length:795 start_codon:yes stop_codon:yes gene_type:complete
MYDIQAIKKRLQELGVHPKKSLGQNFLIYQGTIDKIIDAVDTHDIDQIVEVGPGLGALTSGLQKLGKPLLLIELDRAFAQYWQESGLQVINADALQVDWQKLAPCSTALVSNLPYQISSSLVIEMSVQELGVNQMVLMFQKEVAQRILAKSGSKTYGLLSVVAQAFWQVDFLLEAGPKDFYPPPKIASQVLRFQRRELPFSDSKKFLQLLKSAFHQRRKKVMNNLKSYSEVHDWGKVWSKMGWNEDLRAENLSVEDYIQLFKEL